MSPPENSLQLSIVIPTRDRRETLLETLDRIAGDGIEVIVVDDDSGDGTVDAVGQLGHRAPTQVLSSTGGPAVARNRGIEAARGDVALLLDDDIQPRPGTIERHIRFHRDHPDAGDALLGRVIPAPRFDTPFSRWAHEHGAQFSYALLDARKPVPPTSFWTAQVSVKTALLREVGGFDEEFEGPYFEDVELALRLESAGMRLGYDPDAVAEHAQAIDLRSAMERARRSGPQFRALAKRAPQIPLPRPPGWRHQVRATALESLHRVGIRTPIRPAEWRFLIDEAQRESLWEGNADGPLRIGAGLEKRLLPG